MKRLRNALYCVLIAIVKNTMMVNSTFNLIYKNNTRPGVSRALCFIYAA